MVEVDDFLAHHGVKGMRWGIRKKRPMKADIRRSPDASAKARMEARIKKSGVGSLSTQNLRKYNERKQLEVTYNNLQMQGKPKSKLEKGHKVVKEILAVAATLGSIYALYNSPMVKAGRKQYLVMKGAANIQSGMRQLGR